MNRSIELFHLRTLYVKARTFDYIRIMGIQVLKKYSIFSDAVINKNHRHRFVTSSNRKMCFNRSGDISVRDIVLLRISVHGD